MSARILFEISGHGYGHARRSAQIIAALVKRHPEVGIDVRTTAPALIFHGLVPPDRVGRSEIDAGAAERSPLEVEPEGTLERIAGVLRRREELLAHGLQAVNEVRPALIISDIPFLAGSLAKAAGVPCMGVSNFSWDWIAEPFVERFPHHLPLIEAIQDEYRKFDSILRLPLGGLSNAFRRVIDVPLVANHARRERGAVLRALGIAESDRRRRVLFGLRGSIPTATIAEAARSADDLLFICPTNEPGEVPPGVIPAAIGGEGGLDFSDVLGVCDVVVGKMGYGLIAECIVSGAALLWPRRTGFREDEVVERDGPAVMRMRELPLDDFHAGRWADHIRAAAELPPPHTVMRSDGAEVCADWLAARVLA